MSLLKIIQIALIAILMVACTTNQAPVVNAWTSHSNPGLASDYHVQTGDTVYSIAWAFGMDYRDIVRYNHLQEPYQLHEGQTLQMAAPMVPTIHAAPASKPVVMTPAPKPVLIASKPVVAVKTIAPKPIVNNKNWLWPTQGKMVKSYSLASGGNRGIDIAGKYNQSIHATAAGKVVYIGNSMPGYGNLIIIKHSDTVLSAYAFNKSIGVKEGQTITAGQTIARMGKNSKGQAVLHFEIRENGKPTNPLHYVNP